MNSTYSNSQTDRLPASFLLKGISLVGIVAFFGGGGALAQEGPSQPVDNTSVQSIAAPAASEVAPALPNDFSVERPAAPAASIAPSQGDSGSYIDSSDSFNLGATQRTIDQPHTARLPGVPSTVQVGPMTVGSYGLSFGRTTPSARDYYFRTVRPIGRIGNNNIRLIFPLAIPAPITSMFGWRTHPISGEQRFHSGTDLGAPIGTPVLAAYAGRVALADFLGGYGLTVLLEHNKGNQQTLYGHMSELFVKPGEWVNQGVVIGRVGDTGLSTGPHLHFEFHQKTSEGWVALDAGSELEYALAQLMKAMGVAQLPPAPESTQTLKLDLSATMDVDLQGQS